MGGGGASNSRSLNFGAGPAKLPLEVSAYILFSKYEQSMFKSHYNTLLYTCLPVITLFK